MNECHRVVQQTLNIVVESIPDHLHHLRLIRSLSDRRLRFDVERSQWIVVVELDGHGGNGDEESEEEKKRDRPHREKQQGWNYMWGHPRHLFSNRIADNDNIVFSKNL